TVGDFALFVYYLSWITELTTVSGRLLTNYRQLSVSFARMSALLRGAPSQDLMAHGPVYVQGEPPELPGAERTPADRLAVLDVRGLTYHYPDTDRGIENVSFQVRRGSFVVVTGRIGSGKTTLLQTLLGLLPKEAGEILWNGRCAEDPASFFVPPRSAFTAQVPRLFSETLKD